MNDGREWPILVAITETISPSSVLSRFGANVLNGPQQFDIDKEGELLHISGAHFTLLPATAGNCSGRSRLLSSAVPYRTRLLLKMAV